MLLFLFHTCTANLNLSCHSVQELFVRMKTYDLATSDTVFTLSAPSYKVYLMSSCVNRAGRCPESSQQVRECIDDASPKPVEHVQYGRAYLTRIISSCVPHVGRGNSGQCLCSQSWTYELWVPVHLRKQLCFVQYTAPSDWSHAISKSLSTLKTNVCPKKGQCICRLELLQWAREADGLKKLWLFDKWCGM